MTMTDRQIKYLKAISKGTTTIPALAEKFDVHNVTARMAVLQLQELDLLRYKSNGRGRLGEISLLARGQRVLSL